ncbi:restriction endonuclease subunit S [Vibrio sp. SG41-7]|uniref:restriction endonuclease subunit S n=1 Tax=Vibrio sp. SG41-7 TaxID=2760973 RepID=UPI001600507E|nr:restriction endonuclease subunit S [Vibrio sp. SG41-7]MBB1462997.1 restriction endonuclease subunit S [Vibrio sp. SG41-7]
MVPNGWESTRLNKIAETVTSGSRDWAQYYSESGSKFIRMTNLPRGGIYLKLDDLKYVNVHSNSSDGKRTSLKEGDLLISITAELGKIGWVPPELGEAYINQHTALVRIKKESADSKYIAYLLSSHAMNHKINRLNDSGAKAGLNLPTIRSIPMVLPPLPEQRKIAKILSTWDKAISTTEKLIETSKQQKKSLMQQLLTGKKRLVNPETGEAFDGEWEEVKLDEVAQCLDNKRVPLNGEQRSDMQGQYPYWGANGIVDYINEYIFDEPIVLLAEDGGYFDEYASRPIANISYGKCWVNNHAHIIKALDKVTNEWLYFSLVHKNIMAFINGGTRAKLNKKDMLLIKIQLPSLLEQQKIVSVLTAADKEIAVLEAKLAHFKQEKKALMQQLLTGKRRVKVDEEVAA